MRQIQIGDVTITSIVERAGPWRTPAAMFPAYDEAIGAEHLKTLDRQRGLRENEHRGRGSVNREGELLSLE